MSTLGPSVAAVVPVATSTTVATLLASAASKKMVHIFNDSAGKLYVCYGAGASATNFTVLLAAGGYYETPSGFPYSGIITGILDTGTGTARITSY